MTPTDNQNVQPQVVINTQYVKDLSFESPEAPNCFLDIKTAPKIAYRPLIINVYHRYHISTCRFFQYPFQKQNHAKYLDLYLRI